MKQEVLKLRAANQELEKGCHKKPANNSDLKGTMFHMASNTVKGFTLDTNCSLYAISEPSFFKLIRDKQKNIIS